jgi:hypothetical protein
VRANCPKAPLLCAGRLVLLAFAVPTTIACRAQARTSTSKLQGPVRAPHVLQMLRAIEVLEQIGTPEACDVLETLAQGMPEHRVSVAAREALQRVKRSRPFALYPSFVRSQALA